MIGQSLSHYRIEKKLGSGGMGDVYLAKDGKLGRDVAIKVLPGELSSDPDREARFQREAKVLASLQHQNIASIYGFEECDGQPVLVMELAEGDDLSKRLGAGPIDPDEVERFQRRGETVAFVDSLRLLYPDVISAKWSIGIDDCSSIARAACSGPEIASLRSTLTSSWSCTRPGSRHRTRCRFCAPTI